MRAAILAFVVGCGDPKPAAPTPIAPAAPWSDPWLLAQAAPYLGDAGARRAALEHSLTNPTNLYSRIRLAAYGLATRGWDLLPVWNPRSAPVTNAMRLVLARGEMPAPPATPLWNGVAPATMPEWIALGRRVFFEYPMRAEVFMEYALTEPALADAVGIERTRDGDLRASSCSRRRRRDPRRHHVRDLPRHGEGRTLVTGKARRTFDYGVCASRSTSHGTVRSRRRRSGMASWGPGRAMSRGRRRNRSPSRTLGPARPALAHEGGTIRHDSPLALAIRQRRS